jgi:hypothetical protein
MKDLCVVWVGGLSLLFAGVAWGQQAPCTTPSCITTTYGQRPGVQSGQLPANSVPGVVPPELAPNPQVEQGQAKLRNTDRQRQIVSDTQKLVSLANELKTEVDKSTKDTLSIDVIKKADEIEKLAHSVKEKMKGA